MRVDEWKLVAEHDGDWELYNMNEDRTELNDLAPGDKARVESMSKLWQEWADRCGVVPWPANPLQTEPYRTQGKHAHVAGAGSRAVPPPRS